MKSKLIRSANLRKVTRARLVGHRCLFQAMGMRWRTQIGQVWSVGHEMANDEVGQSLHGGQGQIDGPQVLLLGHGNEIKSPNWACRDYRT